MTALALRGPARRGRHRLTLKRRLIRWNERVAREIGHAQPRRNARRAAFTLGGIASVPALLTAVALALTGLILLVVL